MLVAQLCMGEVGMSLGGQIGSEFQTLDFTHERRTYEVFRGGAGPAVLVLHEIPGLHPGVIDFARRAPPAQHSGGDDHHDGAGGSASMGPRVQPPPAPLSNREHRTQSPE